METNNKVISLARECIGTPFVHQGRVKGVGLDCAGLLIYVAKSIGANYKDYEGYGRLPHRGLLEIVMESQCCLDRVSVTDMLPGDLLLIKFTKAPQHLAIYTGDNRIIHTYDDAGKVVEHTIDGMWKKRIIRVYRFNNG